MSKIPANYLYDGIAKTNRILDLANIRNQPEEIGLPLTTLYKMRYGTDCRIVKGYVVNDGERPLVPSASRMKTDEDVALLQADYVLTHRRNSIHTPSSKRLKLLGKRSYVDPSGARAAYVSGFVVDFHYSQGRIDRICLASPALQRDPFSMTFDEPPVDSHIWLKVSNMDAHAPTERPADSAMCNNIDMSGEIHMGDWLLIAGRISPYRDRKGMLRLGIGTWKAGRAITMYTTGNIKLRPRIVPGHLHHSMTVVSFDRAGRATWADPFALRREVNFWVDRKDRMERSSGKVTVFSSFRY